ncbi:MAG: glycine cleavage system aminomethyltransferase GcvT [Bacteroidota bacterium]|nr:glycine cleavage system aminomethyltransferase GcvT [Bacteroidota bacterium]
MKRTSFYKIYKELNAKLVPFAGFDMPVQYRSIIDETLAVRKSVGVFDVSHMGEIEIYGSDALAFIQIVTTNDASKLTPGKVQYSAMCFNDSGIVDDMLVYNFGTHYMLVVNASNKDKDFDWLKENLFGDVKLVDKSDEIALIAVQGPNSLLTLQKLTGVNLSDMKYYTFATGKLADVEMIISRTGYTGELGFELYFTSDIAISEKVWNAIFEAGKEFNIEPIGLAARDTLRLEMGFCLYGNDIDQTTNPLESGLGWITKLDKGNFNGRDVMLKLKSEGLKRRLVGFEVEDKKAFPRKGYEIFINGNPVGIVTSGTFSPTLDAGIGLGFVDANKSEPGTQISIKIRNQEAKAKIVKLPFVNK